jgi:multiple sugar transport system permease protein
MSKPTPVARFTLYALLVGLGSLFGLPLVWLLITSLKPSEQTMSNPPTLVPRAYYADLGGRRLDVMLDARVTEPSVLVEDIATGRRDLRPAASAAASDPALRVIKTAQPGWWLVTPRPDPATTTEALPPRDVVPPEAVTSEIKPRWNNYPDALAAMRGGSPPVPGAVPRPPNPEQDAGFPRFFANTVIVCVLGVIGAVFSNALVAYGFARLKWRGRDAFFALTLATMMVPFPVLMVPLYGIFKELGWIGTLLPLWVPAWFGGAFNIFLMRQFFRTIPEELSEAARIDGASEWRIFWRIILPLSKPVLAVVALFHFLYAWNDFLGPLLYLTRRPTYTLALALQQYQSQQGGVQWHHLMAASAVVILPVVVLFFFTQKTFVRGVATTGSKG